MTIILQAMIMSLRLKENEQLVDNNTQEESSETESGKQSSLMIPRRAPDRPKLIYTCQRGRPRKEYQTANIVEVETDPLTVEEALSSIQKN